MQKLRIQINFRKHMVYQEQHRSYEASATQHSHSQLQFKIANLELLKQF